jgi:hypothetical protein
MKMIFYSKKVLTQTASYILCGHADQQSISRRRRARVS